MRLKKYLNERQDIFVSGDAIIEYIKEDCKPYLDLLRKNNISPFIRNGAYDNDIGLKFVRKNRKPSGTNINAFKRLNEWLDKNGHARRDISISTRSKSSPFFGEPHYIFPIGKIKYTWIKSQDLNIFHKYWDISNQEALDLMKFLDDNARQKQTFKFFDKNITTNQGIKEAHYRYFEVWWECDKYYHVHKDYFYVNGFSKLGLK